VIRIDFKKILLEGIEEDFQKERRNVVERSEDLQALLVRIAKAGRWSLPTSVMGMETHHPELEKDLNRLERCDLISSKVKYTKHNAYREYVATEKGKTTVKQFIVDV
jgi:DNA-binding HxlR family transcriptional regulator